jgi:hypothetical protein
MAEEIAIATKPGMNTSFGALKQIKAGVLNTGYAHCRYIQLMESIHHERKTALARSDTPQITH